MAKGKAVAKLPDPHDSHARLVNDLLPQALSKMDEILKLPYRTFEDQEDGRVVEKINTRILSMQYKTAATIMSSVVHIEDIALKRKAGSQLDKLLARMKEEKPELFAKSSKVIDV